MNGNVMGACEDHPGTKPMPKNKLVAKKIIHFQISISKGS